MAEKKVTKTTKKAVKKTTRKKVVRKPVTKKKTAKKAVRKTAVKKPDFKSTPIPDMPDKKVNIGGSKIKAVKVLVAESDLDNYRSPHLLDLSSAKFIEKTAPVSENITTYQDFPAGTILERLGVWDFVDWKRSEIVRLFGHLGNRTVQGYRYFTGVDMSLHLPLIKSNTWQERLSRTPWEEITVLNLALFIYSAMIRIGRFFYGFGLFLWFGLRRLWTRDQAVAFSFKKTMGHVPASAVMLKKAEEILGQSYHFNFASLMKFMLGWTAHLVKMPVYDFKNVKIKSFNPSEIGFIFKLVPARTVAGFVLILLCLVIPFKGLDYINSAQKVKGQVMGEADQALVGLQAAQAGLMNFNALDAQKQFTIAQGHFDTAQERLNEVESFVTLAAEKAPFGNIFKSGKNLLDLGENLALAGQEISQGILALTDKDQTKLTEKIKAFKHKNNMALAYVQKAYNNLGKVSNKHLPADKRQQFDELGQSLPLLVASLNKANDLADFATKFLADHDLKRYLMVFQNDNELRATGGFMGSFALVDIVDGEIKNINLPPGGTYDLRAGLHELLKSPEPLQLINPRWELQDANWWPDWPTSARAIEWFYNKSQGPSIDGVIAVNSDWLAKLLNVLGDIELEEYDTKISAANFESVLQEEIEFQKSGEKTPKKILTALAPQIIDSVLNVQSEKILDLSQALVEGLNSKDILVYLTDEKQKQFVAQSGWDGQVKPADMDYLQVVATNINGGKTDEAVKQKIYHQVEIKPDGRVIGRVMIKRHHFGPVDEHFTNRANYSYLRVYVPDGSRLIKSAGFKPPLSEQFEAVPDYLTNDDRLASEVRAMTELGSKTKIYSESDKTVFANWLIVEPGQSKEAILVYELPFKIDMQKKQSQSKNIFGKVKAAFNTVQAREYAYYSLNVQKQSGIESEVITNIIYPDDLVKEFVYPTSVVDEEGEIGFHQALSEDKFYFVGFSH